MRNIEARTVFSPPGDMLLDALTEVRHNFESQLSSAARSQCGAKMVRFGSMIPPDKQTNASCQSLLQLTFSAASLPVNHLTFISCLLSEVLL